MGYELEKANLESLPKREVVIIAMSYSGDTVKTNAPKPKVKDGKVLYPIVSGGGRSEEKN